MDGTFDKMIAALKSGGMEAALRVLNDRVAHRYSAVYRLTKDGRLVNLALVDKQGELCPPHLLIVPFAESFCQFTLKHGLFRTDNSALDERLDGHIYQGLVNSYHAVPFVSTEGTVKGTVCHFDTAPLPLQDEDFELLRLAARVFPIYLPPFSSAS
jgi:GAF domain-containing protein